MALACISGARECTACRLCFSATVCEICGKKIPEGRIYYELFGELVCSDCVEIDIAEEEMVCSSCEEAIIKGEEMLCFEEYLLCSCCTRLSKRKKDYV